MIKEKLIHPIAYIEGDFPEKFGIPRQSGLVNTQAEIHFLSQYRNPEAFRGLEEYSHLWLIWDFSEADHTSWRPTVRPPRLGGNQRVGVFATRSPFRPNGMGLSCVKLTEIDWDREDGPVLVVSGADLMNGTPIYDVKPYLPHIDAHSEAESGFAGRVKEYGLGVAIPKEIIEILSDEKKEKIPLLKEILAEDPRPAYQANPDRVYGMTFAGMEVHFRVEGGVVEVCGIEELTEKQDEAEQKLK